MNLFSLPTALIHRLVLLGMLFGLGLWVHNAQAARAFFDSTFATLSGVCPVTGNVVVTTQSQVGYFTDPSEPYPKTGDVVYVRAMSTNVSPCTNDAVGFDFFFPSNTVFAIDSVNKVRCYRVQISNGYSEEFISDSNGGCSQTPSVGSFGGNYFGWSAIAPGWRVEIRVPVKFNQQLLGIGGPNTHKLKAVAQTVFGNAVPEQAVTSFYETDFANFASTNITGTAAKVSADVYDYYRSGSLVFDYGISTSFGQSVTAGTVDGTQVAVNGFADLTGLSGSTTYYWRARYVTSGGTFTSPTQTFTTSAAPTFSLTVNKAGTGSGTVSSNPTGINCGATCSANFTQGASVTLSATAAAGSSFAGWSGGGCSGTGNCTVTLNSAQTVTATFNTVPSTFTLTVSKAGSGSGTVSSNPAGIDCGATCSASFNSGASVTLSASPASGSTFAGWSGGGCSGTGNCVVSMNSAQTVTATFNTAPSTFTLTINKAGSGSGSVSSTPAGIDCGATCSASFNSGASVTLTASPASGSSFSGWSGGGCSGTGNCVVTISAAQTVTATFNTGVQLGALSITVNGLPSGNSATLTITGPGGTNLNKTILTGTGVTLNDVSVGTYTVGAPNVTVGATTYVPSAASQNANVTFGGTATVNVVYSPATVSTFALTLSKAGSGSGTVSSNPAGITCGATCSSNFTQGTTVTLNAAADAGSTFAGWSGACTGTGNCTLSMDAAKSVTATFNTSAATTFTLSLSKQGSGSGTITSNPSGLDCGSTCSANFAQGATVALSATAASGSTFAGWSGACSGSGNCTVTMDAAKSVTATFNAATAATTVTASKPTGAPQNANRNKGQTNVPILAFNLTASQVANLQGIGVQASGTGNDSLDLTAVKLFQDTNANAQIDAGETAIASGTFSADNGNLNLSPSSAVALGSTATQLIVAVDINSSLASSKVAIASSLPNLPTWLVLLLVPMLLVSAWRLRSSRVALLAVALALTLAACGGSTPTPTVSKTYQINLTSLNVQGSPTLNGLPIAGTIITVQK